MYLFTLIVYNTVLKGLIKMKKTIATTNKHFSDSKKREKMIVNAVHSSVKVEGSKITKKELKEHYKLIRS